MPQGRNRRNRLWVDAIQASIPLAATLPETVVGQVEVQEVALVFPANTLLRKRHCFSVAVAVAAASSAICSSEGCKRMSAGCVGWGNNNCFDAERYLENSRWVGRKIGGIGGEIGSWFDYNKGVA